MTCPHCKAVLEPRVLSREAVEKLPRYRMAHGRVWRVGGWDVPTDGEWVHIDDVLRLCPADAPAQETTP